MNIQTSLFYFIWVMLILAVAISSDFYLRSFIPDFSKHRKRYVVISLVVMIITIIAPYYNLPVVLYLIVYYRLLRYSLSGYVLSNYKKELYIQITFLFYAGALMILTGAGALTSGQNIMLYFSQRSNRVGVVFILQVIALFYPWLLAKCLDTSLLEEVPDVRKSGFLFWFLWCCVGSVLFDALFCRLDLAGNIVSLLLIGANILMLVMVYWLVNHDLDLVRQLQLEREAQRLSVQQAQEQLKTMKLRRSVEKDTLTGVYSRRYILNKLEQLNKKAVQFCLVYIDMDNLKKVNDEKGHMEGDALLIEFARSLGAELSPTALLARLSGDEFMIVMQDQTLQQTQLQMEEIRKTLIQKSTRWPLAFSYGVVQSDSSAIQTIEELMQSADQQMYRDKQKRKKAGGSHV